MRVISRLPGNSSDIFIRTFQKRFGSLRGNPESRIEMLLDLVSWLKIVPIVIHDSRFFELGTGRVPTVPVCLYLMGAQRVLTVDLNRRLDLGLLKKMLNYMAANKESIKERFLEFSSYDIMEDRFIILQQYKDHPEKFFSQAEIEYRAPCNAAKTDLADSSFDCHLSITVLEHIPPDVLLNILKEAKRLLGTTGVSLHLVDLTDHFSHGDKSIPWYNFLRYSQEEWQRIAGNQFAYTNRMRSPEYFGLFRDSGFNILKQETRNDFMGVPEDFPLDDRFSHYDKSVLSTIHLKVLLR